MAESRKARVSVSYSGKNITSDIKSYLTTASYTDAATGESDSIALNLEDRDKKFIGPWRPEKGDRMSMHIITQNWKVEGDYRKFLCGDFVIDDLDSAGPPVAVTIGSVSVPQNEDFRSKEITYTWQSTSLAKIATDIAKRAGVGLVFDAPDIGIETVEQNDKPDCDFLYALAEAYGYSMKVYAWKIVIFSTEAYELRGSVATLNIKDLLTWSHNDTIQGSYTGATMAFTDPNDEKDYIIHIGQEGRTCTVNKTADNIKDAELKGIAALNIKNQKTTTLTVTIMARPGLSASACVNISGLGKLNGKYYIDKIKHTVSGKGAYKMTLTMHKVIAWIKTASVEAVVEAEKAAASSTQYVVKSGDTLWAIAKKYLGSGTKCIQIYNDNKDIIESTAKSHGKSSSGNGHWIWPGETLTINT